MIEIAEIVIDLIKENVDITYMLVVNVFTYGMILIIDEIPGKKRGTNKWTKRVIAFTAGLMIATPLYYTDSVELKTLIYSFLLSLVSWDYLFKPLAKKLNIGYKENKKENEEKL